MSDLDLDIKLLRELEAAPVDKRGVYSRHPDWMDGLWAHIRGCHGVAGHEALGEILLEQSANLVKLRIEERAAELAEPAVSPNLCPAMPQLETTLKPPAPCPWDETPHPHTRNGDVLTCVKV